MLRSATELYGVLRVACVVRGQVNTQHVTRNTLLASLLLVTASLAFSACTAPTDDVPLAERELRIVATTSMLADLAREVGGEHVTVSGLMGPGIDPHLYRPTEGNVQTMIEADLVLLNGLDLEGKMGEVFQQLDRLGIPSVAIAEEAVPAERRINAEGYAGSFDPHVWMDVTRWQDAVVLVGATLAEVDPAHAESYQANATAYHEALTPLDAYVRDQVATIPEGQRVLITAHDAFSYFGDAYGIAVRGLQGLSTDTEAGTADVQRLAEFVAERRIPAMFVESSISPRSIEAVKAAVRSRGFDVAVGGTLYSDALGPVGSGAETYIGMITHNVDTVVEALAQVEG
ncbi:MAG: zinc ABC transporter substrate-binding protein [Bacteroidota bacterium]